MGWVKVVAIAVRWTIAWTESLRHGSLSDCVCVCRVERRDGEKSVELSSWIWSKWDWVSYLIVLKNDIEGIGYEERL